MFTAELGEAVIGTDTGIRSYCAWSNARNINTLNITTSDASGEYYLELTLSNNLSYIGKYIIE